MKQQGDLIPASAWGDGMIWCWWHPPKDLKGLTPLGWVTSEYGAVFAQFGRPVGNGEILVLGTVWALLAAGFTGRSEPPR